MDGKVYYLKVKFVGYVIWFGLELLNVKCVFLN